MVDHSGERVRRARQRLRIGAYLLAAGGLALVISLTELAERLGASSDMEQVKPLPLEIYITALAGLISAVAGLITAVTGLLVVLQQRAKRPRRNPPRGSKR